MDSRGKRIGTMIVAVGIAATLLTGCSSNAGANTTCDTYNSDSTDQREEVVTKMLKSHGESTDESAVATARFSVAAYCLLHSGDSKVGGVYNG